jgi:hypothetical protein
VEDANRIYFDENDIRLKKGIEIKSSDMGMSSGTGGEGIAVSFCIKYIYFHGFNIKDQGHNFWSLSLQL